MKVTYSTRKTVEEAVKDLSEQFSGFDPKMVLFFASSAYDPHALSQAMEEAFDKASVFGCNTAGEIVSGKMLKQSVVAMAFEPEILEDVAVEVIEDVHDRNAVEKAFTSFEKHFNVPMLEMSPQEYVGLIVIDGLSMGEEKVMERIGDRTDVTFVGGSAGDDLQFKSTYVFANGKAYTNAAVLALLKPLTEFDILKTQSFRPLDKQFVASRVNEDQREVLEFNGKSASAVYAKAVGASIDEASHYFMRNPVGLIVDDELYVRSPQQIKGDSMVFYCNVREGMKLSLLESQDIVEDTRKALEDKKKEMGRIAGIVNFHCILRTLELEDKAQMDAYGKLFSDIPTIGFSTYGEQYIGHINQTSTMLVFKEASG